MIELVKLHGERSPTVASRSCLSISEKSLAPLTTLHSSLQLLRAVYSYWYPICGVISTSALLGTPCGSVAFPLCYLTVVTLAKSTFSELRFPLST